MAFGYDDAALALLSFFGGLVGPDNESGQKYKPFTGALAAPRMLAAGTNQTSQWLDAMANLASQPVHLRGAYAQGLPGFSGGGLPMNIGAPAQDPGLLNKNLYDLPGLQLGGGKSFTGGNFGNGDSLWDRTRPPGVPSYGQAVPRGQANPDGKPSSNLWDRARGQNDPLGEAEDVLQMMGITPGRSMVR